MIEVPTVTDCIELARTIAPALEGIARLSQQAMWSGTDRELAREVCSGAVQLALQLRTYAARLEGLRHRHLEGIALGYLDERGRRWLLHHALHWGNLMTTARPEGAALWPDLAGLEAWVEEAGRSRGPVVAGPNKGRPWPAPLAQHAGRELMALPVRVVVDPPVATFRPEAS